MISIDSRTIKKGEYFVPIKGPNFDGNEYIDEAIKKEAKGIISEEKFYKLAKSKIDKKRPFIIAVAGSIGKSTFRSYLYSVLKTKYSVLESDQNTKLGFALKILNSLKNQKIVVAEIGIDVLGEMKNIASFVKPDLSIITKLGKEHLEFLKSYKNVVCEESKIIEYTKSKFIYINTLDRDDYLKYCEISNKKLRSYDIKKLSIEIKKLIEDLVIPEHEKKYLVGICHIAKKHFKFRDIDLNLGLKKLIKPKGRMNLVKLKDGSIVIDDTYNAVCDQTIIEGIKFVQNLSSKLNKKLKVVIPNMVENGLSSDVQHRNISNFVNKSGLKEIYIVGNNLKYYKKYLKIKYLSFSLADEIKFNRENNTLYYIKATRRYLGPELVSKLIKF
ncbi:hypothetical protein KBD45_06080 [Candidatus Dojkabacteria bacterium]|nr:hypothetical protein [Candidatus Dojkabacteria bacterium]